MTATTAPEWLKDVSLVTFDCFGTLIDWRAGLAKVDVVDDEGFRDFEKRCLAMQQGDRHVPYARVLKEVLAEIRPSLRRAIVGLFADDIGRLPPFGDSAHALASLKQMVKVGVMSNCDANHQLDVMSTLRVAWDLCITSQDIRAYKPTDRAWDTIVRMGVARTAVHPEAWLHVSSFHRYDLGPARARRLRTCLLHRPNGDRGVPCDMEVTGLDELVSLIARAKDGPLVLEICSRAGDDDTRDELRRFLVGEMMPRVRSVPGVLDVRVSEDETGELVEQYTFGGRGEYDAYQEAFAAEHHGDLRARFGARVERRERLLKAHGKA